MNKKIGGLIIVSALVILLGAGCSAPQTNRQPVQQPEQKTPLLGGDRDAHGCIGSAGYSWCEAKQKCLRVWEEKCEENTKNPGCALENCHGLDIKCGPNPPDVCTEIYMIGDKCLKYAKCGVQNGKCEQIQNSQFTQCKSCVQKCIDANKNDTIASFDCEGKCN